VAAERIARGVRDAMSRGDRRLEAQLFDHGRRAPGGSRDRAFRSGTQTAKRAPRDRFETAFAVPNLVGGPFRVELRENGCVTVLGPNPPCRSRAGGAPARLSSLDRTAADGNVSPGKRFDASLAVLSNGRYFNAASASFDRLAP